MIEFRVYDEYADYAEILPQVAALFTASFGKTIPWAEWEAIYRDGPYGSATVVAGFDDNRLVAHHAMIPGCMEGDDGQRLKYPTTATLMIAASHRSPQLFVDMMDAVHAAAQARGAPFLLGFPNAKAHLPLARFANWTLLRESPLMAWSTDVRDASRKPISGAECVPRAAPWGHPWDAEYRKWKFGAGARRVGRVGSLTIAYRFDGQAATVFECACDDADQAAADLNAFAVGLGATEVRLTRFFADRIGLDPATLRSHEGYVFRMYGKALSTPLPDICPSLLLSDAF